MSKLLWTKWYWNDWLSDIGLRSCSLGARGLWADMLAIAGMHDPIGYVCVNGEPLTSADLARMVGATPQEVDALLGELERAHVFSRDRKGRIYNRRMIKDQQKRDAGRTTGKSGGNPALTKGYDRPGFLYLVGTRNDGAYKVGITTDPKGRLKKLRQEYPGHDLRLIEQWPVGSMGETLGELEGKLGGNLGGNWFLPSAQDLDNLREKMRTLMGLSGIDQETRDQRPESNISRKSPPMLVGGADVERACRLAWNDMAQETGLSPVTASTPTRRKALAQALQLVGGQQGWVTLLDRVRRSPMLTGQRTAWRASYDWLLKPSNLTKVMEGNYDDSERTRVSNRATDLADQLATERERLRKLYGGAE